MTRLSFPLCFALLLSLGACGSSPSTPELPSATDTGSAGNPIPPPATASIKGKIFFDGPVPKPIRLQTSADPACTRELFTEDTKVKDGGLANVFVYVSGGLEGKTYAPPPTPVEINQVDCHYAPHAFVIQVGQQLNIRNSDMTLHNIHMFTERNPPFNTGQPVPMLTTHVFQTKEILIPVKCDVHKWMSGFIAVVDNPYATVSAEGGGYELKLPAGKFEITAIHEKYGMQTMTVEVKDGDSIPIDFRFKQG